MMCNNTTWIHPAIVWILGQVLEVTVAMERLVVHPTPRSLVSKLQWETMDPTVFSWIDPVSLNWRVISLMISLFITRIRLTIVRHSKATGKIDTRLKCVVHGTSMATVDMVTSVNSHMGSTSCERWPDITNTRANSVIIITMKALACMVFVVVSFIRCLLKISEEPWVRTLTLYL